jgi:Na+/H+ antiporter NhaD/arsenite permease-like protein
MAALPIFAPRLWERRMFQGLVAAVCALPVVAFFCLSERAHSVGDAAKSYFSFVSTLAALYVTSGGIHVRGDLEATPRVNLLFLLVGATLASAIGTTGASMLLIRPMLRTNRQRTVRGHLVPFFILAVANAGGLLTPLGDPPLLVGYINGVPFFWTLWLLPFWLLYVGSFALTFYLIDRRAYALEPASALDLDRATRAPLVIDGKRNIAFLIAIVPSAMLPAGAREMAMVAIAIASYATTKRSVHDENGFSFGPIADVAIIFAGLFMCLGPIESLLAVHAQGLPLQRSWQLFWGSGLLSAVLDNAPTYTAFAALARGLSVGHADLVAGISPLKLAAVSVGSVVMGATTYIGNGPNLMVKAIADREKFETPSFGRYALFALAAMLPAHAITTLVLALLD